MNKFYFIVNLIAGAGRCKANFERVKALLSSRGLKLSFAYTEYPKHAVELARKAAKEAMDARDDSVIVAVGGDGTAQEVAEGLYGTNIAMGLLPFGTGNDLARVLRIPSEPEEALNVLLRQRVMHMDMGDCNGNLFLNVAGFGFDSAVLAASNKYKRFGKMAYMYGVIETLFKFKSMKIKVTVDEQKFSLDALLIDVANGSHYGGGMEVAPGANPFDGLFNVCIAKRVNALKFLSILPKFIKGKHVRYNEVLYFKAENVSIESDRKFAINLDGDLTSSTPVRFSMLPYKQPIIVGIKPLSSTHLSW